MKNLSASEFKIVTALSPGAVTAGSSNPVKLGGNFKFANLVATIGSLAEADLVLNVQRSATSNGTFYGFGASIAASVASHTFARGFTLESSAVWYKVAYTATGAFIGSLNLLAFSPVKTPVDQETNVDVLSSVL